jgi:hypothetical protein
LLRAHFVDALEPQKRAEVGWEEGLVIVVVVVMMMEGDE